jgi:hypothetical protein
MNKWKWALDVILAMNLLLLLLSIWTLFFLRSEYGMLSFGTMFSAWLVTITLAVLFGIFVEG